MFVGSIQAFEQSVSSVLGPSSFILIKVHLRTAKANTFEWENINTG